MRTVMLTFLGPKRAKAKHRTVGSRLPSQPGQPGCYWRRHRRAAGRVRPRRDPALGRPRARTRRRRPSRRLPPSACPYFLSALVSRVLPPWWWRGAAAGRTRPARPARPARGDTCPSTARPEFTRPGKGVPHLNQQHAAAPGIERLRMQVQVRSRVSAGSARAGK